MDYILGVLLAVVVLLFCYLIYIDRKECKEVTELKKELEARFQINKNLV